MAFLEQRLDARIERLSVGGPINRGRTKNYTASGKMAQDFLWSMPIQEWDVSHGLKSVADYESLRAMWYVVNFTPYEGFLFRDWSDYQATATNTSLSLITGSTYQLERKYTFGAVTFKRKIVKPESVAIYNAGGTLLTATVDLTNGTAVVTGTPSYWIGTFAVPVTFADNEFKATLETSPNGAQIISPAIKLEEVRL